MKNFFFNSLRNIYILLFTRKKFLFIFNYHQIDNESPNEIIKELHSIKFNIFKIQIKIMRLLGTIVSLDDLVKFKLKSKVNFIITFDDVSRTFNDVINFLEINSIPVTVCPSYSMTDKGYGWRNKVYKIIDYLDEEEIKDSVNSLNTKYKINGKDSFYKFTKEGDKNSIFMEEKIINPLFKKIKKKYAISFNERIYLDWGYFNKKIIKNKNFEIANHSFNHYNMSSLTRDEIFNDFEISDSKIREKLNVRLNYFAVPFGSVTNNLLVNLNDIATRKKYKVVLWVTNAANIIDKKKTHQIYHLSRIHTPTSLTRFIKILIRSFIFAESNILPFSKEDNNFPYSIELNESSDMHQSLSIENLLRPNKDFASDPEYYNYLYTNNIFKGKRNDYLYTHLDNCVESILYNFHAEFLVDGKLHKGVYWAGGRSLPFKRKSTNALAFIKSMKEEPIIGSYKPNNNFQKGLTHWKKIEMFDISFDPNLRLKEKDNKNFLIKKEFNATNDLDKILEINQKKLFFSLNKSTKYYQWRYDNYCYAKSCYYILYKNDKPSSFILLQYSDNNVSISDFSYFSLEEIEYLLKKVSSDLISNNIKKITIETNRNEIVSKLKLLFNIKIKTFSIYYYFNKKNFKSIIKKIDEEFNENSLNETQTSGDILIR